MEEDQVLQEELEHVGNEEGLPAMGNDPQPNGSIPEKYRQALRSRATGYGWPQFGHKAELKSLAQHVALRRGLREDAMPAPLEAKVLAMAVSEHKAAQWNIPSDLFSVEHFVRILEGIDMKSSPGYPYCVRAPTNRDFLKADENGVIPKQSVTMLWEMVSGRLESLLNGESSADYIRLFIKPEPLKEKKLETHRYRIIASVSIVDQIIDHMLFDDMNQTMYQAWDQVPSKVGWSPYVGGWKFMPKKTWLAIDKSSWDWTVQLWLIDLTFKLRQRLCQNMNNRWLQVATMRYRSLYVSPLYITSAGVILRQRKPGVMKSGCVNTIADNSIMQYLLHLRACHDSGTKPSGFMSMGDDTLQEEPENVQNYLDALSSYCIVKKHERANEFAGMLFKGMYVEPQYLGKHAFTILHMKESVSQDIAVAYSLLYHRSHYRKWIRSLFIEMGYQLPSIEELDAIYDGDD